MSLPANQIKEPGKQFQPAKSLKEPSQESLPGNLLKEPSQESRILCPDPDIVSAPRCAATALVVLNAPPPNPAVRFFSHVPFSAPILYFSRTPHPPGLPTTTSALSPGSIFLCLLVNFSNTCSFPPRAPPSSVQSLIAFFSPGSLSSLSLF